jgi:hypothetical protein
MKTKVVILGGSMDGTYEFPDGYRGPGGPSRTPEQLAWGYVGDCKTLGLGWSIVGPSLRALEQPGEATDCYCLIGREVVDGALVFTLKFNADRTVCV